MKTTWEDLRPSPQWRKIGKDREGTVTFKCGMVNERFPAVAQFLCLGNDPDSVVVRVTLTKEMVDFLKDSRPSLMEGEFGSFNIYLRIGIGCMDAAYSARQLTEMGHLAELVEECDDGQTAV